MSFSAQTVHLAFRYGPISFLLPDGDTCCMFVCVCVCLCVCVSVCVFVWYVCFQADQFEMHLENLSSAKKGKKADKEVGLSLSRF